MNKRGTEGELERANKERFGGAIAQSRKSEGPTVKRPIQISPSAGKGRES